MERLQEILEEINASIDYDTEDKLIDKGLLDSLSILSLLTELEGEYDIEISPIELIPDNFNSKQAMWTMIERLRDE